MSLLILTVSVLFIFYKIYKVLANKNEEEIEPDRAQFLKKEQEVEKLQKKPEKIYQLQTHSIKYWLYDPDFDFEIIHLYNNIIKKNFWINEPFHSVFYEILLIIYRNKLIIADDDSKIITMNIRDNNNKMCRSKAYQVFFAKNFLEIVIRNSMSHILKFNKHISQNFIIAICIVTIKKSIDYQSTNISDWIIELLKKYKYEDNVKFIISLIEEEDNIFPFIQNAFQKAYKTCKTEPYFEDEISASFKTLQKLPSKSLQQI